VHLFIEFALQLFSHALRSRLFDPDNAMDVSRYAESHRFHAFAIAQIGRVSTAVAAMSADEIRSRAFARSPCSHFAFPLLQVLIGALRCLLACLHFPLPQLKSSMQSFVDRLFVLLADYAALGAAGSAGHTIELNLLLFKVPAISPLLLYLLVTPRR
jgi:hypothetical protein